MNSDSFVERKDCWILSVWPVIYKSYSPNIQRLQQLMGLATHFRSGHWNVKRFWPELILFITIIVFLSNSSITECLLSKLYRRLSVLIFLLHIHERILQSKYFSIHIIFQTGKNDLPTQKWWWSYRLVGYKFQLFHYNNRKKSRISHKKYHFLFSAEKMKNLFLFGWQCFH